jgi:enoyl-[acyl-carrier protein] reductase III
MSSASGPTRWALIAKEGLNIFGVHFDRRSAMDRINELIADLRATGRDVLFFNINAADASKRAEALDQMQAHWKALGGEHFVKVFLHSVAFGSLKPFISESPEDEITQAQMEMTVDVMGNNIVYWVQELMRRKMLGRGSRIYGMTSAGGHSVIPSYGAVSAAKAVLESNIRQLAFELIPHGITANAIQAGITLTAALAKIPGSDKLSEFASARNPGGRLTTPQDVAEAIAALMSDKTHWLTGNTIRVDGGEDIVT